MAKRSMRANGASRSIHGSAWAERRRLALSYFGQCGRFDRLEKRRLLTVYTVANTADSGPGSFRQAILDANANIGNDTINFSIGTAGTQQTIAPLTAGLGVALPVITDTVFIDGWSQGGGSYSGTPLIKIDGTNAPGTFGLNIQASDCVVRGLAIGNFAALSGNGYAIGISSAAATNTWVYGNFLGVDFDGATPQGNGQGGIWLGSGTSGSLIGTNADGTNDAAEGNLISANAGPGVLIDGSNFNTVAGNRIGVTADGLSALGNTQGIAISNGSTANLIGGAQAAARNILSGNSLDGVDVSSPSNRVVGNFIGTDITGSTAIANGSGVRLSSDGTLIGTDGDGVDDAAERNVISGNTQYGVSLNGASTNKISGNYIGVDAAGISSLPNGQNSVVTFFSTVNYIGTDGTPDAFNANERNVINGSVLLQNVNVFAGNFVGLNAAGTAPLSGAQATTGVQVSGTTGTRIGTNANGVADDEERNVISNINGSALLISQPGAVVAGNYIGTNAAGTAAIANSIGISLGTQVTGVRIGTDADGINDTTERNVISGNTTAGISIDVQSHNNLVAGNLIGLDSTGTVAIPNLSGVLIKGASHDNLIGGTVASAANLISGNTTGILIQQSGTTLNTIFGNRIGTDAAGLIAIGNSIGVSIGSAASGNFIGTNGDGSNDPLEGNLISGNTQTGVSLNTGSQGNAVAGNLIGTDVSGLLALPNAQFGILINNSTSNQIGGTLGEQRNVISGNGQTGLEIINSSGAGNTVYGNLIGTNATGMGALPNLLYGIRIANATSTIIGGPGISQRNIISGNVGSGINIDSTTGPVTGTMIQGNYIGVDLNGMVALANGDGVYVGGAADTTMQIGGTAVGSGNTISGNLGSGINITNHATNVTVQGNFIGVNKAWSAAVPNGISGITIIAASNNLIGGTSPQAANAISGNVFAGIRIGGGPSDDPSATANNLVLGNTIGLNGLGTGPMGNGVFGIQVWNASGTVIGGLAANAGNVISGTVPNASYTGIPAEFNGAGIVVGWSGTGTLVQGNRIGTSFDGTAAVGNAASGIAIQNNAATVQQNQISGNAGAGIYVTGDQVADGLNGLWHAENSTSSGYFSNATGSLTSGATYAPGKSGQAFSFDGLSGALVVPATQSGLFYTAQPNGGSTLSGWVKTTDLDGTLMSDGGGIDTATGMGLFVRNGRLTLIGSRGTAGQFNFSITGPVINDGQWHQFAATWTNDATTNGVTLYMDGALVGTDTALSSIGLASNAMEFGGHTQLPTLGFLNGLLDELSVYNNVLTAGDIAAIYAQAGASQTGIGATLSANLVGTNPTGTAALPNGGGGVVVANARNVNIGGTGASDSNLISGNTGTGLLITGPATSGSLVEGNLIGLNLAGSAALPNTVGLALQAGAHANFIGSPSASARNVISGNTQQGIVIDGLGTDNNIVINTYVGLNKTGLARVANQSSGILVSNNASFNRIGTDGDGVNDAAERNVVSGNGTQYYEANIDILGPGSSSNIVAGNYVGITAAGTTAVTNPGRGIRIGGGSYNRIGTDGSNDAFNTNERNIISGSSTAAIFVVSSSNNSIAGNYIGLDASGTAALGNTKEGISISSGATGNRIGSNADGIADAAEANVIVRSGTFGVQISDPGANNNVVAGNLIGTSPTGNVGMGNLQAGVVLANSATGNTIGGSTAAERNIISANQGPGVRVVQYLSYPAADGNSILGNYIGTNASGTVPLPNTTSGIWIQGSSSTIVGGLAAGQGNLISGNAGDGVVIENTAMAAATGNSLLGNRIGTNATGSAALANGANGVLVQNGASGNFIGSGAAGAGNLISGNAQSGVLITGVTTGFNYVQGNTIGLNATGTAAIPNLGSAGVALRAGTNHNFIGTEGDAVNDATEGNTISGNTASGILIADAGTATNTIAGNWIGTTQAGATVGNNAQGVLILASNNLIGSPLPYFGNEIAFNAGAGIAVQSGVNNALRGNSLHDNTGLGIDLNATGVDLNDLGDTDTGSNNGQNVPVIDNFSVSGGQTLIGGSLNSHSNETYLIDFYLNSAPDLSGLDQGRTYLGSTTLTTYVEGNGTFLFAYPGVISGHGSITVTATDSQGNTSELSYRLVNNQRPTALIHESPFTVYAGQSFSLTSDSTDPDGDALAETWTFDDGTTASGSSVSHAFLTAGLHQVILSVADPFGGISSYTLSINASPAPPVLNPVNLLPINEGSTTSLSGSFTDPVLSRSGTIVIDWGDASVPTTLVLGAGVRNYGATHTYLNGSPTDSLVTITLTTSDGLTTSLTAVQRINNVAPSLNSLQLAAQTILEGGAAVLTGTLSDPGLLDTHTVLINWGDGLSPASTILSLAPGQTTFNATRTYADDTGPGISSHYNIQVTLLDQDGAQANGLIGITVNNVAPTTSFSSTSASTPTNVVLQAASSDPGTLDTVSYSWLVMPGGLTANGPTFSLATVSGGIYTVTLTATDSDGASSTLTSALVMGSDNNDTIQIVPGGSPGQVTVTVNLSAPVTITVPTVQVLGLGGNDVISGAGVTTPLSLDGGAGDDNLTGGTASDTLIGTSGSDLLQGGDGNNTFLSATSGVNTLVGAAGDDTYVIIASPTGGDPILQDSGGVDTLDFSRSGAGITLDLNLTTLQQYDSQGTGNAIQLTGQFENAIGTAGNDSLVANNTTGSVLVGGAGDDSLFGGNASDTLIAGTGNTKMVAGSGAQLLYGGTGNATMSGGSGNTTMYGSLGNTTMTGGTGNATMYGSLGNTTMGGGSGNTTMYGSTGNATMGGGTGNTTMYGSLGNTTMTGGAGNTTMYGSGGNASMQGGSGNTTMYGSLGNNTMVGGPGNSTMYGSVGNNTMVGGAGNSTMYGSAGNNTMVGGQSNTTMYGSTGNISMGGGTGNTTMYGSTGNITMRGGGGNSTMFSAAGNTTMYGSTGNTTMGGGSGNTTMYGSLGNTTMQGGGGNATMYGSTGNTTMGGGSGNTTMYGSLGNTTMQGGGGNATMYGSTGNTTMGGGRGNTTMYGSSGNTTMRGGGGNTTMYGSQANDLVVNPNHLPAASFAGNVSMLGDSGNILMYGGLGNITMGGGSGNTTMYGSLGGPTMQGGGGNATLYGTSGNISMAGGSGNTTMYGALGNLTMVGGSGNTTMYGAPGSNTMKGGSGNTTMYGSVGNDSMMGGSGNATMYGGGGVDALVGGIGGQTTLIEQSNANMTLTNTQLILAGLGVVTFQNVSAVVLLAGAGGQLLDASAYQFGAWLAGGSGNDTLLGGPGPDTLQSGTGNDLLVGGAGDDTYVFGSGQLGNDQVVEAPDTDADVLDFSNFSSAVSLDLQATTTQAIGNGLLNLALSNGSAFEGVIGSGYNDLIKGNNRGNTIIGAGGVDSLYGGSGDDVIQAGRTQVVYLDFDSFSYPGAHAYTQLERDQIQAVLGADYAAFNYSFTQTRPTNGSFVSVYFNRPLGDYSGGSSSEIGWRHLNYSATITVDINQFVGQAGLPANTSSNIVALSATIAAHELGHISGLSHADAFGPIGSGVSPNLENDPDRQYNPSYPGPYDAIETSDHLMGSPASIGTDLFAAVAGPFFGEREAVKLAFADHGTTIAEQTVGLHDSLGTAQNLPLTGLYVPSTALKGTDATSTLSVKAINVVGSIHAVNGQSEDDYYSFTAKQGDVLNIQLMSSLLARIHHPIDGILRVYDSQGNLIAYNARSSGQGGAFDDDTFETIDPSLIDLHIPADGTYYIQVDTYYGPGSDGVYIDDTQTGDYELFVYSFKANAALPDYDSEVLDGGSGGNDILIGGSGPVTFVTLPGDENRPNAPIVEELTPPEDVSLNGNLATNVGAPVTLLASFTTALGAGPYTYQWVVTDSSGAIVSSATQTDSTDAVQLSSQYVFTPSEVGSYSVSFTVTNYLGAQATASSLITVGTITPSVSIAGASSVSEEYPYVLQLQAQNLGNSPVTGWSVDWGDGSTEVVSGNTTQLTHRYADGPISRIVQATATIGLNTYSSNQVAVLVTNVAPAAAIYGGPAANGVDEGTAIHLLSQITDPSDVDASGLITFLWSVSKDGSPVDPGPNNTGATFDFTPADSGSYVISLTATDKDGATSQPAQFALSVLNLAPTPVILNPDGTPSAPATGLEGTPIDFRASATDPSAPDTLADFVYVWSVTRAGQSYQSGTGTTFQFAPDDDGTYLVSLTATDKDGGSRSTSHPVVVANVAPAAGIAGPTTGIVGSAISLNAIATDPSAADTLAGLQSAWTVANGATIIATGAGSSIVFTPNAPGSYTVSLSVTDKDGAVSTPASCLITVVDSTPIPAIVEATNTGVEGSAIHLSASATNMLGTDVTADTVFAWSVNRLGLVYATGSGTAFSFTPNDSGPFDVTLTATNTGGTASIVRTILVSNVAPTPVIGGSATSGSEGSAITLTATATDPSSADTAQGFAYSWTVIRNSTTYATGSGSSFSFTPNDNALYSVSVVATDKDGDSSVSVTRDITVTNVAPTVTAPVLQKAAQGLSTSYNLGMFTDPGTIDNPWIVDVNWGDGTPHTVFGMGTQGTITPQAHTYAGSGTYTITVQVTDKDGGVATSTFTSSVGSSMYVLDPTSSGALTLSGNASIQLAGSVVVNSTSSTAVRLSGNSVLSGSSIQIAGSYTRSGNGQFSPAPTIHATPATDPLASLPVPLAGASLGAVKVSGNTHRTLSPGTYTSISVSGNGALTLNPGLYIILGGGLSVSGNGSLTGSGVTIYNGKSSTGPTGAVSLSGNGSFQLTPMTTGDYAGVLIFQARDNTRALNFSGNAMLGLSGAVYAQSAMFTASGNAQVKATFVVDTVKLSGNASSSLVADGSQGESEESFAAGQLLGNALGVYIDAAAGVLSTAQYARIADVLSQFSTLLAPYNVSLAQVADASEASITLTVAPSSTLGTAADGILGTTTTNGQITIVQGWNWYNDSDPMGIQADQYDFETIVAHELGHALGLGHSTNASSVMYAALAPGATRRELTTSDLNLPDDPSEGAHALLALRPASYRTFHLSTAVASELPTTAVPSSVPLGPVITRDRKQSPGRPAAAPLKLTRVAQALHASIRSLTADWSEPRDRHALSATSHERRSASSRQTAHDLALEQLHAGQADR